VQKLTTPRRALSLVGEVGTFVNVALGTVDTLLAESINAECTTDWSTGGDLLVSIGALRVSTVAFGIVETGRRSLWGEVVREIASVAILAFAALHESLADGNLVGIVHVAALRPLVAKTCGALDT
jgi:hypothetical protein